MKLRITILAILSLALPCLGTLRVASYNIANGEIRTGLDTVLQSMCNENKNGIQRPLDVLVMQEQDSVSSTTEDVRQILNSLNPSCDYQRSTINGSGSGGTMGAVYNYNTVRLLNQYLVPRANTTDRHVIRYKFQPVGYSSDDTFFYIYVMHLKASRGDDNESRRFQAIKLVRQDADSLGDANIIYAGDFNVYNTNEAAFQELIASGNGQAFDPVGLEYSGWSGSSYKLWHTQAPSRNSIDGMISGGMDDRFDFQFITNELDDEEGLAMIADTFRGFGNNGTHSYDNSINTGSGAASNVLYALMTASDHIPVVAEYQLPAVMGVSVLSQLPSSKVVCPGYSFNFRVSNTAADSQDDELDYTITTNLENNNTGDDPGNWSFSDIGTPPVVGAVDLSNSPSSVSIVASGRISGTNDNFTYVYRELADNGELSLRLSQLQSGSPAGEAGLMIRETLADNSRFAWLYQSRDFGLKWRTRLATGDSSALDGNISDINVPVWLKIARAGNIITGSYSVDGISWNDWKIADLPMNQTVYIGMAVGEYTENDSYGLTASVVFDQGSSIVAGAESSYTVNAGESLPHSLAINSDTPGEKTLQLMVQSESQGVENGTYNYSMNYRFASISDFDGDNDLDINDINLLIDAIGTSGSMYDLDGSGIVDTADLELLIETHMGCKMGDINFDGAVNMDDLIIYIENYLQNSSGWQAAEFNNDLVVNLYDLSFIAYNWGL